MLSKIIFLRQKPRDWLASKMRLEILDGLGNPVVIDATRVVVRDEFGNPVAFAVTVQKDSSGREHLRLGHAAEANFQTQLHNCGLDRTKLKVTKIR